MREKADVLRMMRVVPSEGADKMACGTPPGNPELLILEVPLTGQDDFRSNALLSFRKTIQLLEGTQHAGLTCSQDLSRRAKRANNSATPCREETGLSNRHRETGHMYVGLIRDLCVEEATSSRIPKIEQAWWTLMLRIISWYLAVHFVNSSGYPIPCYLYYNQTPVLIM
jgi:hypothetical protein